MEVSKEEVKALPPSFHPLPLPFLSPPPHFYLLVQYEYIFLSRCEQLV